MPKDLSDIMREVTELNVKIKQILYHADFEFADDLSEIEFDRTDAEQLFLVDHLRNILTNLEKVSNCIDYLSKPVSIEGILHKNENGYYEVNGKRLPAGRGLDYLATDDYHCIRNENGEFINVPYWRSGRIEHNGNDYYMVGAPTDIKLEGLKIRIKRE